MASRIASPNESWTPACAKQSLARASSSISSTCAEQLEQPVQKIRVVQAMKESKRIDTEKTIASIFLGRNSSAEKLLFTLAAKSRLQSRVFQGCLWGLWWFGASAGMLCLIGRVPETMIFLSALMLPLPIFALLVLCVDLIWEVLVCFECYLISFLQMSLVAASMNILADRRIIFWLCVAPTMAVATFADAYPSKYRSLFAKLFFTSMGLVYGFWLSMLVFGWLSPIRDIQWELGQISGRSMSSIAQTTVTLLAFCGRQLFWAAWWPDKFVIIISPMKTTRVDVTPQLEERNGVLELTGHFVRADKKPTLVRMSNEEREKIARISQSVPPIGLDSDLESPDPDNLDDPHGIDSRDGSISSDEISVAPMPPGSSMSHLDFSTAFSVDLLHDNSRETQRFLLQVRQHLARPISNKLASLPTEPNALNLTLPGLPGDALSICLAGSKWIPNHITDRGILLNAGICPFCHARINRLDDRHAPGASPVLSRQGSGCSPNPSALSWKSPDTVTSTARSDGSKRLHGQPIVALIARALQQVRSMGFPHADKLIKEGPPSIYPNMYQILSLGDAVLPTFTADDAQFADAVLQAWKNQNALNELVEHMCVLAATRLLDAILRGATTSSGESCTILL